MSTGRPAVSLSSADSARAVLVLAIGLTIGSRCVIADEDDAASRTGVVRGRVLLDGPVPQPRVLVPKGGVGADGRHYRDAQYLNAAVYDESLGVGKDGGIANVVVYVKRPPSHSRIPSVSKEPLVIEQSGGRLHPHVMVVRTGQSVVFRNREKFACNLNPQVFRNTPSGFLLAPHGEPQRFVFQQPESVPIPVRCDIHPWMRAHWLIIDHPYAAVTDTNGRFEIRGLPPGEVSLTIWHERVGYLEKSLKIQIDAGEVRHLSAQHYKRELFEPKQEPDSLKHH